MNHPIDRRLFLGGSAAALGYFFTADATSAVRAADNPSGKLRFAGIGIGGKGDGDISQAGKLGEVVAICDIDELRLDKKAKEFPQAKRYYDFRKLFDEVGKEVDAVTVSTPDHTHAVAALQAIRMKKHAYVQKPLTHFVMEARILRDAARKYGVCTQMGNQGSAANGLRRGIEIVQEGIIGPVKEVHVWTNRPVWPQAPEIMKRPEAKEAPASVHWNEFLGPAPERPYAPSYHPFKWRGFWDFGTGAIGDMACHTANMAFRALKLGHPTTVVAEAGDVNPETCPSWAHVTMQFPARDNMPPCTLHWYEGKKDGQKVLPPQELLSRVLKEGEKLANSGSLIVGEKGLLFSPSDYGSDFRLIGEGLGSVTNLSKPEKLPINGKGDQGMKDEWAEAIRQGKPEIAFSNFDIASLLTEAFLLGNVAIRTGEKLEWDGPNCRVTNSKKAQDLVVGTYRKGWEVTPEV